MSADATNGDRALLATEDVVAGYVPEVDILNGVSIHVVEGEVVTVIGPNGAGKSTLIKTIFGLLRPRQGRIVFEGDEITALKPHECTRRGSVWRTEEASRARTGPDDRSEADLAR